MIVYQAMFVPKMLHEVDAGASSTTHRAAPLQPTQPPLDPAVERSAPGHRLLEPTEALPNLTTLQ
jgi:hypothetical protein